MADDMMRHERVEHSDGGGYERTDASMKAILYFTGGLLALIVAAELLMGGGIWLLDRMRGEEKVSPLAPPREVPPQPRLQVSPARDMKTFLQEEQQVLEGQTGVVTVPIEQAIERVLSQGLPTRAASPPALGTAPLPLESGGVTNIVPQAPMTVMPAYRGGENTIPVPSRSGEIGAPPVPNVGDDKEKLGGRGVSE